MYYFLLILHSSDHALVDLTLLLTLSCVFIIVSYLTLHNRICLFWTFIVVHLLVILLSVLLVLFAVLPLAPPIGMTNLHALKLILDVTDFILEIYFLHLCLVHPDYILDDAVVLHGNLFIEREVAHEFALQLIHPLAFG